MRCPVLTYGVVLPPYARAMRRPVLMQGTVTLAVYARAMRCAASLDACYAMSGTDRENGATSLGACYAMSGTELAYGAISAWRKVHSAHARKDRSRYRADA
eukprot:2573272-Rhodomonas_salina.1